MTRNKRGFNRAELLLACVIVGAVASIVFSPVFNPPGHEKSKQSSCLSNLKQLGLAFQQYAQDYDGKMPGHVFHPNQAPTNTVNGTGWIGPMYSYIKSAGMLKCPEDKSSQDNVAAKIFSISYAMNSNLVGMSSDAFQNPQKTVCVFEISNVAANVTEPDEGRHSGASQVSPAGNGVNGRLSSYIGAVPNVDEPARYATGTLDNSAISTQLDQYSGQEPRHTGGSNFLLSDGHAKWFRPSAISAGGNALKFGNLQSQTGCAPDGSKHTGTYPCAAATDNNATPPYGATFSIN